MEQRKVATAVETICYCT